MGDERGGDDDGGAEGDVPGAPGEVVAHDLQDGWEGEDEVLAKSPLRMPSMYVLAS